MVAISKNIENYYDVIVVGAGISGIGAGYYLQKNCNQKTSAYLKTEKILVERGIYLNILVYAQTLICLHLGTLFSRGKIRNRLLMVHQFLII